MKNFCFRMTGKTWMTILMVLCLSFPALAQKITVTGTVYDNLGEPLMGASVIAEGAPSGVGTDLDGNYRIEVEPNAVLIVSYIGFESQRINVDGRTHIDVTLSENAVMLQEVVAIGYGVVKKSDATGSVAVIKPDDIEAGLATSTQDLLVGASPGVVVTPDGGNPTGGASIRIRGGSSLSASNDPLIVIDGVPQTNQSNGGGMSALTMVNPANIESMTILKDASATAIYGSRASNGVIIITTKKGQSGRPQVSFAANFSVNTARNTLKLMNAAQFIDAVKANLGESSIAQLGYTPYGSKADVQPVMYNTNWQKEVLRTTFSHDYSLSVGGTAGILPYRVNVSYTNNEGILKTSSMDRATVGINLSPKFFNGLLQVNANVQGTYATTGNADTGAIGGAASMDPTKPVMSNVEMGGNTGLKLYNGYYNYSPAGVYDRNGAKNPVQLLNDVDSKNKTWSSSGNLQIDYALHFLPDLHLNLNLGYQVSKNDCNSITAANSVMAWTNDGLTGMGAAGAATLYKWHEIQQNTLLDFYANYRKNFEAIKSNLDVMVGYSWQRMNYFGHSNTYVHSLGFVNSLGNPGFNSNSGYYMDYSKDNHIGEVVNNAPDSRWGNPLQLISFFGRVNYSFDDTYLLTVNLRDDASSRFSKNTRWGLFPSVALGWKLINYGFMDDARSWLNDLKLRLGWGQTGQQDIGSFFPYMPIYSDSYKPGFQYPSISGEWINPLYPQPYDQNIKWETTTTWNVALDFGFLNNRITGSIEYYLRNTKDLLAHTPALGMNTSNFLTTNIGSLRNYGIEFNVTARPVVTQNFTWTTGLNVAWNRNEITALTGDAETSEISARGLPTGTGGSLQWHLVGQPAYTFRVYQQVYDNDGNPVPNQYVDQNADGKIDDQDLINFHSPEPKVTLAWNNNFNYKNWDFGFSLRASMGNWVYNNPRYERTNLAKVDAYGLNNLMRDEFLFKTNPEQLKLSDYFVENAAFLRCDNITVGYTFDHLLKDKLNLRLFGACQNPFVITKYKGLDPEVFSGIDNNVYPRPVTFTLGLVATF
ncbi:MAG: TonB-dependent receptor [Muribaculaceae bacterium]|nr:TonB-dependent receptor [Muribaculaceae bacterium]